MNLLIQRSTRSITDTVRDADNFSMGLFSGKKALAYLLRLRKAQSETLGVRVFFVRVNDKLTTNPHLLGTWFSQALLLMSFFFIGTSFCLNAHGTERDHTDELQLVQVGDDCIASIQVFNRRLTKQQMLSMNSLNPVSAFTFITDYCDRDRVGVGIFGEKRELTRKDNNMELGRGAPYSDEEISISVTRGPRRLKIVLPPPAACDDGYLETTEFFDATTTVKAKNKIFNIPGTLIRPGCTKAPLTN